MDAAVPREGAWKTEALAQQVSFSGTGAQGTVLLLFACHGLRAETPQKDRVLPKPFSGPLRSTELHPLSQGQG